MAISKDKKKAIDALMGKVNKRFGTGSINYLVDVQEELKVKFYKTPSHEVNAMLSGGVGKGKIIEFYGNNSSGKTSMALEIIAKAQKEDPEFMAAWIETERSLDSDYIAKFGIDMERFTVVEQSDEITAEDCMEIIRSLVSSGMFGIICLNSVAALSPKKEIEDNLEDAQVALTARLLSKFLRITTGSLGKTGTSLILINQVRANIGGSKYNPTTTTGGMAIPFYSTQRIEFRRQSILAGEVITEDQGIKVKCKTVKNRLAKGNPYKTCMYYALYGKGIDSVSELSSVLVREGIITGGSWMYYPDKDNMKKVPSSNGEVDGKWNGKSKFTEFLRDNPETVEFFTGLIDEKLSSGPTGESVSADEVKELEKFNEELDAVVSKVNEGIEEETAMTE